MFLGLEHLANFICAAAAATNRDCGTYCGGGSLSRCGLELCKVLCPLTGMWDELSAAPGSVRASEALLSF